MPRRARPEEQARILAAAVARARAGRDPRPAEAHVGRRRAAGRPAPSVPGVAVFDLDSTVLDNRPRQARILQEYGRAEGLPALTSARPELCQGWDLEVALLDAGLSPTLAARHAAPLRRFWLERFFTSAYCRLDVPTPGAPEFVRAVAAAGARVAYVTGRPASMAEGTLDVLGRHGFPVPDADRVHLLMKPDDLDVGDDAWKERACAEVDALGPVVLAFDNEPSHVNAYARAWPAALVVHLDTNHSGRPVEVLARVPSIVDFRASSPVSDGVAGATAGAP
jgi:hypothetical protein